jgi:hypothetical protein
MPLVPEGQEIVEHKYDFWGVKIHLGQCDYCKKVATRIRICDTPRWWGDNPNLCDECRSEVLRFISDSE